MTVSPQALTLGAPRFDDPALARLQQHDGAGAAWRAALAAGPAAAAAKAGGEFAVALRDDEGRVFMAVDRYALRGLCFRIDGGTLHFAERADDLAGADATLDAQALFDYL
jgi:asparagine synthase (glutamine-hydrolysing)